MGEIRVKSENLATDVHTWERAELNPVGVIVPTPTSSDYGILSDYIPITGGGTYTYSHNNGFPVNSVGTNSFCVIGWWDINKNWINRNGGANDRSDLTITAPNNAAYARLCYKSYGNLEGCSFVTGSTALPYQPYFLTLPSHQKTSTGWKDIPTHTMTATGWQGELTSQSPLEFRATGQSLLDWRVDGKTSENLFDKNNTEGIEDNYYINQNTGDKSSDSLYYISAPIAVTSGERYYWIFRLSSGGNPHAAPTVGFYDANDNQIGVAFHNFRGQSFPFTPPANCAYIRASVYKSDIDEAMLVKSSIAPTSYEPYGGVGVKTENVISHYLDNSIIDSTTNNTIVYSASYNIACVPVILGEKYSMLRTASQTPIICAFFENEPQVGSTTYNSEVPVTLSGSSGTITSPVTGWMTVLTSKMVSPHENMVVIEGENIPSTYIPYGYKIPVTVNDTTTNLYTDAQLMDGDSLDFATDQTSIPITQGDNTLTVDTAVQPSKVFVKFEG